VSNDNDPDDYGSDKADDTEDTDNLAAQHVHSAPQTEKPARRWAGTTERVRRHPIGVAVGTAIAGLLVGGALTAALVGGSTHDVGPAGVRSHYAAEGPACLGGPPPGDDSAPPPPGGPGHHVRGGPGRHDGPGREGPGGPGQQGPGGDPAAPAPAPRPSGTAGPAPGAPAAPTTPLLPAEGGVR
jgi:hypothetical protein